MGFLYFNINDEITLQELKNLSRDPVLACITEDEITLNSGD